MPPVGPLRKDDGPACRVCGCTEHNACVTNERRPHPSDPMGPATTLTAVACSWVETSGNEDPRWLCSVCSGTAADMMETIDRGLNILLKTSSERAAHVVVSMARAAKIRYETRLKTENRG